MFRRGKKTQSSARDPSNAEVYRGLRDRILNADTSGTLSAVLAHRHCHSAVV